MSDYYILPTDELARQKGFIYKPEYAEREIRWAEKHFRTPYSKGNKFEVLDFQKKILRTIYGWRHKTTNECRWKAIICSMGKKNSKTLIAAMLALREVLNADVPAPKVIAASTTKDNLKENIWLAIEQAVLLSPTLKKNLTKLLKSDLTFRGKYTGGSFRGIPHDPEMSEGANASLVLL